MKSVGVARKCKIHKFYLVCGRTVHMEVARTAADDASCFWFGRIVEGNEFEHYEFTNEYAYISESKICMYSVSNKIVKEFK